MSAVRRATVAAIALLVGAWVMSGNQPSASLAQAAAASHQSTSALPATGAAPLNPASLPGGAGVAIDDAGCAPVAGNPWGYTFCGPGSVIPHAPVDFCSHFACIDAFWEGPGYIVECADGLFSHSGGYHGACFFHNGVKYTLYSPQARGDAFGTARIDAFR